MVNGAQSTGRAQNKKAAQRSFSFSSRIASDEEKGTLRGFFYSTPKFFIDACVPRLFRHLRETADEREQLFVLIRFDQILIGSGFKRAVTVFLSGA